uniref:NAD(P)-binding protein n=1 Tax=Rhabditophanes sp. KR3021 TaxID=114890 RepID=A0AC35THR8_9BILA
MVKPNYLITGASRGIGFELVKQLSASDNANHIFATCRNPESSNALSKLAQTHKNVIIIKLDVTCDKEIDSATKIVTDIVKEQGLNVLINNAGIYDKFGDGFLKDPRSEITKIYDTNAIGPYMVMKGFIHLLKQAASETYPSIILNISSGLGSSTSAERFVTLMPRDSINIHYGATKAALNHYVKTSSLILKEDHVSVFAMCPGWVRTDLGGEDADLTPEESISSILDTLKNKLTLERSGEYVDNKGIIIPY